MRTDDVGVGVGVGVGLFAVWCPCAVAVVAVVISVRVVVVTVGVLSGIGGTLEISSEVDSGELWVSVDAYDAAGVLVDSEETTVDDNPSAQGTKGTILGGVAGALIAGLGKGEVAGAGVVVGYNVSGQGKSEGQDRLSARFFVRLVSRLGLNELDIDVFIDCGGRIARDFAKALRR